MALILPFLYCYTIPQIFTFVILWNICIRQMIFGISILLSMVFENMITEVLLTMFLYLIYQPRRHKKVEYIEQDQDNRPYLHTKSRV